MKISSFSRRDLKGVITKPLGATKGNSGSVLLVLGGATYTGAGILTGLAALRAGVDIVGIIATEETCTAINAAAPDIIAHRIQAKRLSQSNLTSIKHIMERYTAVLIGPGADLGEGLERELIKIAKEQHKLLILDADLTTVATLSGLDDTVLCTNRSEYEKVVEKNKLQATLEDVHAADEKAGKKSKERLEEERTTLENEKVVGGMGSNILIKKGHEDLVFTNENLFSIAGGSLRSTVAGTGDVLAGIIAAFRAQGLSAKDAAVAGCSVAKRCAEILEEKYHLCFLASDFMECIGTALKELKVFRVVKHT